ncbi:GIY-YIG nuclease family protein [Candidatus Berkelbacteria bacterium]|uniref:GIY-YIG domain-containing protein n=1 Tax=Candidatus Berkelbacteria bacterium CG10_big_fil_rev_8_21_14_0_10_43_14 TaxID=1974515 RepID=A0A2M6R8J5_9BACT|nr:GIY-YIG nuclease family protein [Candidatus Berkelbacteria bacterium]OIP06650.1 MAG: hypothetical protein AUK41_01950 [Candidatus Berkelbacteria bacterium CG2_30_43_20]PIS06826.1 MAG: hypothetical protein COT79_02330 [Candidatus Berkelbacteria bacterium CG10_big_fil_rev_8_21_14_0_10_43_14]PIU87564.1 MAG: hypothetical protein COS66_00060 [Candidatus Berkelbacteria bacterium CG06_land_8_20_14_3_00_43_10]
MKSKSWFVYIIICCDKTYYTGITTDLSRRITVHNSGKGARYTAQRRPVTLVWYEMLHNQSDTRKREIIIKDWRREKKEILINNFSLPHSSK